MQPNETIPSAELLSDLGNSEVRTVVGDEREYELLRLAADPLLLSEFVKRDAAPAMQAKRPVAHGLLLSAQSAPADGLVLRGRAFDNFADALTPSLRPEVFVPSEADCALPANGDAETATNGPRSSALLLVSAAMLVLCGALLLVLI